MFITLSCYKSLVKPLGGDVPESRKRRQGEIYDIEKTRLKDISRKMRMRNETGDDEDDEVKDGTNEDARTDKTDKVKERKRTR